MWRKLRRRKNKEMKRKLKMRKEMKRKVNKIKTKIPVVTPKVFYF